MNPRLALSTLQLATFVVAVLSSASSSSPSPLLSKSIVGGSLKPPVEETSTLFGVTRKNVAPEDEAIFVVKRDGSKEPLEKKKVGHCTDSGSEIIYRFFDLSFSITLLFVSIVLGFRFWNVSEIWHPNSLQKTHIL